MHRTCMKVGMSSLNQIASVPKNGTLKWDTPFYIVSRVVVHSL